MGDCANSRDTITSICGHCLHGSPRLVEPGTGIGACSADPAAIRARSKQLSTSDFIHDNIFLFCFMDGLPVTRVA